LLGDEAFDLQIGQRQQLDRLLQLRRHHQLLRLSQVEGAGARLIADRYLTESKGCHSCEARSVPFRNFRQAERRGAGAGELQREAFAQ
jgi:hypothetical protein